MICKIFAKVKMKYSDIALFVLVGSFKGRNVFNSSIKCTRLFSCHFIWRTKITNMWVRPTGSSSDNNRKCRSGHMHSWLICAVFLYLQYVCRLKFVMIFLDKVSTRLSWMSFPISFIHKLLMFGIMDTNFLLYLIGINGSAFQWPISVRIKSSLSFS